MFFLKSLCSKVSRNVRISNLNPMFSNLQNRFIQTKAIRIHETGDSSVLKQETIELKELTDGEILIKNEFAGLNFIDTYQRSGLYKLASLPATLGVDGSGIIHEITPKASEMYSLKKGDRVAYYDLGSYSEYKILNGSKAIPLPNNISFEIGAACCVQGMTAHYLSRSTFPLDGSKDDWCVVHAAAGGVGQFLVQIAKIVGAKVIGTVSSEEKAKIALDLGCDFVCNYSELESKVKEVTNGLGVNVVYDGVGKSTYETSLKVLMPRGMCVFYGNASGAIPPIDPLKLSQGGSLYLTRPVLAHYTSTREETLWRSNEIFDWINKGLIKVSIDSVLTLNDVPSAHKYIEDGKTMGKVVFKC